MFHGSSSFLMDPKNDRRPYTFFVFDDVLIIMEPPLNIITHSGNEAQHDLMMAKGYTILLGFIAELQKKGETIISKNFLDTVKTTFGKTLHVHVIKLKDITSATVDKKLIRWYLTLKLTGDNELQFRQGKNEIHDFCKVLEKAIGKRLIWLKR